MNGERSTAPPPRTVDESGVIQALGPRDLSLAASVGKYRFLGALGHGGMADVYLTMADGPEGFRKLCVVKMLKDTMANDEDFRAMFVDEARLAARLTHPNIVQTYEVESVNGHLMLAMEYVEGPTMARLRRRMSREAFPLTASVRVLCDVLAALSYAHGLRDFDGRTLDIVHRDVSPHNIIVGYNGNAKLLDFGIAKSTAAVQATQAGVLKGKVGYMAPEQAGLGDVDHRADIFSVVAVSLKTIAGRRLAEGKSARDSLSRRINGTEPRIETIVPDVDRDLAQIVAQALATAPGDRYPTADAFQADLEAWLMTQAEMPRRVWAAHVSSTFDDERRQFQSLVGLRASDASINLTSNVSGAHRAPTSPFVMESATVEPSVDIPVQTSLAAPTLSLPPQQTSQRKLAVIVGGAALAVALVVAGVYVATRGPKPDASSGGTAPSTTVHPAGDPLPPQPTVVGDPPATSPSSVVAIAPGSAPTGVAHVRHGGFTGPLVVPTHSARPTNTATTAATATPKSSARPLDERDPYAP